jgi:hypothetical protein
MAPAASQYAAGDDLLWKGNVKHARTIDGFGVW